MDKVQINLYEAIQNNKKNQEKCLGRWGFVRMGQRDKYLALRKEEQRLNQVILNFQELAKEGK